MYCLGRALDPNPEKNKLERVSPQLKKVCLELGLNKIKMPVSITDIPKFKKKFNINIIAFGHNQKGDIHIRYSRDFDKDGKFIILGK